MEMTRISMLPITESSQVGDARRRAATLAGALGFSNEKISDISIIATEMASNLIKHATKGYLIVQALRSAGVTVGVEIFSIDKGPGMVDIQRCLEDGYTTAGSLGTGLGAIQRMSDQFDLISESEGSLLWSRNFDKHATPINASFSCICLPIDGEIACGDSWSVIENEYSKRFLVVDGLGHGQLAADVAQLCIEIFHSLPTASLESVMRHLHDKLRTTRGGVVAIAEVPNLEGKGTFCGIGNISTTVESTASPRQHLLSDPGIVGYEARKFRTSSFNWDSNSILIMHSDGCSNQWGLSDHSGLVFKPAALIAGTLFRDCRKAHDDCTILVHKAEQK